MYEKNIGIIPARAGSKGIPRKNLQKIGGKPMIQFTFEAALRSKLLDSTFLSTDDLEIIELAKEFKLEIPSVRPRELAQDSTNMVEVIDHVLQKYQENYQYFPEYFILLPPTSPFRDSSDIDNAIKYFLESGKESLVSVCSVTQHPAECVRLNNENKLEFIEFKDMDLTSGRQKYIPFYFIDGAIYICTTKSFYSKFLSKRTLFDEDSEIFILPNTHSIDINETFDLNLARAMWSYSAGNLDMFSKVNENSEKIIF